MAAVGKPKEADRARCRRYPSHRHAAGVCPFCLSNRLSRISAADVSSASSSSASSPRSSGEASVASASASAQAPPPCREARARRARLGMLMRQEETDTAGRHGGKEESAAAAPAVPAEEKKPAKRSTFWARLQQASWYRKDGCSLAHSRAVGDKAAKRAPLF